MSAAIVGAIGGGFLAAGAAEATAMTILGGAAAGAGLGSTVGRALGAGGSGGASSGYGGSNLSVYDPYAQYRPQAAADLQALMAHPEKAKTGPGYQQQLQEGVRAQEAAAAAGGKLQSGGESAALMGIGQLTYSNYYNNMVAQLAGLSGATQSPASAAQASQAGAVSAAGQQTDTINSLLKGVSGLQQATNFLGGPTINQNLATSSYMNADAYQGYGNYSYFPSSVGNYDFNYGA